MSLDGRISVFSCTADCQASSLTDNLQQVLRSKKLLPLTIVEPPCFRPRLGQRPQSELSNVFNCFFALRESGRSKHMLEQGELVFGIIPCSCGFSVILY